MQKSYRVIGMHCQSCVDKITRALSDKVKMVQVTLHPPKVILEDETIPDLKLLNSLVSENGSYSLEENLVTPVSEQPQPFYKTYYPLFLIVGLISLASFAGAQHWHDWMQHFMAGFFIVFSFFKFLDLSGFKTAYATYDLLAGKWNAYGYVYPFLEMLLGFCFLFQIQPRVTLINTIMLMGFSSLGVIQALREKRKIRCACLGTVLNLPMSTITLVEDLGMVLMAVLMLLS